MNNDIFIISARWIVPVEPADTIYEHYSLVVENHRIKELLPSDAVAARYPGVTVIERPDHVLVPGLINAHTHGAMSLFRGIADDIELMSWLQNHVWPAEARWVNSKFVQDGTQLAIAEMLLSGTTCFSDMYFYPDAIAKTVQDAGLRAAVGLIVLDFPSAWADGPDEYFDKAMQVHDEVRALSNISTTLAPHAPYTVSDGPLKKIRAWADELNTPIHMHVHETRTEVEDAVAATGVRPLARLNDLGLLNPRMIAVHMTQLEDQEIDLAALQGISVVHCPASNAKLASGRCRVADLMSAGVNVALGTDGAASNNNLDMFAEMRLAGMLAKLESGSASALPANKILEMATINGARALNQADQIGSLVAGKFADVIAVDLNQICTQPVYDPVSQLIYSASREQVSDVWAGGVQLLADRQLTQLNRTTILANAASWGAKIATPIAESP